MKALNKIHSYLITGVHCKAYRDSALILKHSNCYFLLLTPVDYLYLQNYIAGMIILKALIVKKIFSHSKIITA